jgi:hypothetical protein
VPQGNASCCALMDRLASFLPIPPPLALLHARTPSTKPHNTIKGHSSINERVLALMNCLPLGFHACSLVSPATLIGSQVVDRRASMCSIRNSPFRTASRNIPSPWPTLRTQHLHPRSTTLTACSAGHSHGDVESASPHGFRLFITSGHCKHAS